jgi:hypothetical protein
MSSTPSTLDISESYKTYTLVLAYSDHCTLFMLNPLQPTRTRLSLLALSILACSATVIPLNAAIV